MEYLEQNNQPFPLKWIP